MSPRSDDVLLDDMISAINAVLRFTNGMDYSDFVNDERTTHAVIHDIAVIGEASKRLTQDFKRRHPDIPWADMARTRDKLTHGYFAISHATLWKTIQHDLPQVKARLMEIRETQ